MLLSFPTTFFAQQVKKAVGTYTYYAPEDISLDRAKRTALERAQIEAIAEAFGTDISQHNSTRVTNKNGDSDMDFLSISSSDVKGEWIETIGNPEYTINYDKNMLVVKCIVTGKIREIKSAAIDIKAKVLRNGTDDRFESSEFRSGDDMYLSFQSPVDGYLAVYLLDEEGNAFCLLPYRGQTDGIYKVEGNKKHIFFSEELASIADRHMVDEYVLTCEREQETNQLLIIFSPDQFFKANDVSIGDMLPRELKWEDFQKWHSKQKQKYPNLYTITQLLTIKN